MGDPVIYILFFQKLTIQRTGTRHLGHPKSIISSIT